VRGGPHCPGLGFIPWDDPASVVWRSCAAPMACRLWAGRRATVASPVIRRCGRSLVPGGPRATGDRPDVTGASATRPPWPSHRDQAVATRLPGPVTETHSETSGQKPLPSRRC